MSPDMLGAELARVAEGAELVLGEGVMGLFDGAPDGTGSTADLAQMLNLPVLLIVDVFAQVASAAATVHGFQSFRSDLEVAGVVFNRVGGEGHRRHLAWAMESLDVPVLGFLPVDPELETPSRHLGAGAGGRAG